MSDAWWAKPFRMVQTNLRMQDILVDKAHVAQRVKDFGADVLLYNVGGIYACYPTDLEFQARNPFLGETDALAEMIAAARAAGLRFAGRFDPSKSTRKAYEAHPDWFVHNRAGKPLEYNGTYAACVNSGWYQDYVHRMLEEVLGRYAIDALFFNMFGYRNTDYSGRYHGICTCRNCATRFRDFAGTALPVVEDFSDPAWRDYLRFQEATTDALHRSVYETVKRLSPETAVMGRKWACDLIRLEVQRAVDRPQPEWAHQAGEQARFARSAGRGMTYLSASANFVDYAWRFVSETGACNLLRFAQQLANGASLDYYVLGTLDQDDRKAESAVAALFRWHAANARHYEGLTSGTRVALYHSQRTLTFRGRAATTAFRGAYLALVEARIPFDLVSDSRAAFEDFGAHLGAYDVILMPSVACLSDAEAAALDDFVRAGGTVIATGPTALFDDRDAARPGFGLECLPVADVAMTRAEMRGSYFRIAPEELDLPLTRLVHVDGTYWQANPKTDAEAMLRLVPPQKFGPPELCYPEIEADWPGVVSRRFGAGTAIYLPWQPELIYHRDGTREQREILAQLIRRHHDQPVVVRGAGRIEFTVQRQAATGSRLVHIVNYSGQANGAYEEPSAIHGLALGLKGARPKAVRSLIRDEVLTLGGPDQDGRRFVELPPVGAFDAILIQD